MLAKVCSAAVNGIEAYLVEVEANVGLESLNANLVFGLDQPFGIWY